MTRNNSFSIDSKNLLRYNKETQEVTHYRKTGDRMLPLTRWNQKHFYFLPEDILEKEHLLLLRGRYEELIECFDVCNGLYNYETGKMVTPKGMFDEIHTVLTLTNDSTKKKIDFVRDYHCFVAWFKLHSTYQENNFASYLNPVTHEEESICFTVSDDPCFAFIDLDGHILGDKIFKGKSITSIYNTIDLSKYSSLEEYKNKRIQKLNQKRREKETTFYEQLEKGVLPKKDENSDVLNPKLLKLLHTNKSSREN